MAIDYELLGKRISHARNKKSLTQDSFAEDVNASREFIARVETGKKAPSLDLLVDIANALGVSADDLLVDSLDHSSSTADTELHKLLLDCNKTEQKILVELVKYMKAVLYSQGI